MWDMMSRGTFNGPGGPHTRWLIPPNPGGSLGAQHNIRNKRFLNFITDNDLLRLNRNGLAQTGLAVAEIKAREVAPGRRPPGVRVCSTARATRTRRATTTPTRCARARGTRRRPATVIAALQRLHDGGRAADRLGLVRAGPRRPDRQAQDRQPTAASTTASLLPGLQPEDINQVDYVKADGTPSRPRSATSASSTTARSTPASTPAASTSASSRQQPALLHRRQAHRRPGRPALQGRRALARRRRPADARRRSVEPGTGTDQGFRRARSRSRTRVSRRRRRTCTRRTRGVPRQRHLPAVGVGAAAPAGPRTCVTRWPPRSSARRVGAGLHREGPGGTARSR